MSDEQLIAPFQYFGGKRDVACEVWSRFGKVKQFGEPFCGSAAVLLAAPEPANLEVIGDMNGFIANFWRAVANQPGEVAKRADYPVSHIDIGARHIWLMAQRGRLGAELQDPNWPGDAKVAGWWLWGQVSWIGSGWCDWEKSAPKVQVVDVSDAGQGINGTS
jgi:DNA adenine methylase